MIRITFRVLEINLSWVIDVNKSVFFFFKIQLVKPNSHIINTLKSVRKESNNEKQTRIINDTNRLDNHSSLHHNPSHNNQKYHNG